MADDDHFCGEIVSNFLLKSCFPQRLNNDSIAALLMCARLGIERSPDDDEVERIPLSTGSTAEFYIQPMLSYVGDIDVMYHHSNELAIPEGTAPPTHLPDEFHSRVEVFDILDSEFPGYVYLQTCYLLTECTADGSYNAVQCPRRYARYINEQLHGPAIFTQVSPVRPILHVSSPLNAVDMVLCIRCLSWPSQAVDWPTRHRKYDWPDSATVDRIVSNGCDVVRVAHRQCRQDEWMGEHQFRLSFSRAEIVLLNSWLPVQQIVYHMLRVFMKTQQLTEIRPTGDAGAKMFSNYNLKTLMMWACERKPRSWWTDDMNVVRICVELLHTLGVSLTNARCQHYFIHNCNLMDHIDNSSSACIEHAANLALTTETWLAEWFVHNYIKDCAQLCPDFVSLLFDNTCRSPDLEEAVSLLVHWRQTDFPFLTWNTFIFAQLIIISNVSEKSLNMRVCLCWMTELAKLDRALSHYFTAVAFLHVARKTTRLLEDELLDVLATLCLQSNDLRRCGNARHKSVLSLNQAATLMKVVANSSRSTVQLIEIELCKTYLHRALRLKDFDSDSIYCLANVYLAVLYYTTGQYQMAIDHCTLVTRSQDHSHCSSHVVQGELLPKIDNKVDNILGLCVFYQHVRTATLRPQQQTQHVSVFTPEYFAYYLCIRCLSVTQCPQLMTKFEIQRCRKFYRESYGMFITDVLAMKSVHNVKFARHFRELFGKEESKLVTSGYVDTSELVVLLQQSAIEHLTTFRQLLAQQYCSVLTAVTTDYEALYAYKCGEYQQCLQLSTDNVRTLISDRLSMSYVHPFPKFIQLMDDDIVSLTGLMLVVDPTYRKRPERFSVKQLILSLYLMTQCQIKLRHSVTSLAQTLDHIEVTRHDTGRLGDAIDQLLLKLTEHKILMYITSVNSN